MPQQKAEFRVNGSLCLAWNDAYKGGDRANGYWCPCGPTPGVAYVWMLAPDKEALSLNSPLSLSITGGKTVTFPKLWFDMAVAASGSPQSDNNRAYLVRLYDSRFLLRMSVVNRQFNVRRPAPDTLSTDGSDISEFYADSILGAEPHNWDSAAQTLWGSLPAGLVGPYPGLPLSPEGSPQNIRYQGVCAWDVLHELLGRFDCTTRYDPIADKFSIISQSAQQPDFSAAQSLYPLSVETAAPRTSIATRLPDTIRVYFYKQSQHFGTEPDTPADENWADDGALFSLDFFGGGTVAGTVVALFDDKPAITDFQGNVVNQAELSARGQARAGSWAQAQVLQAERSYTTYQGVAPEFVPGSQVSSVWWRDVGDGVLTEVQHYPEPTVPPWEKSGAWDNRGSHRDENFQPPDFARHSFPVYPRNLQLVQVANNVKDEATGLMIGEVVAADPGGAFTPDGGSLTTREPCLIADSEPGATGQTMAPKTRRINQYLFGRLNGTADRQGQKLPLYIADRPPPMKHGTLLETLNPGGQADVLTADGDTIRGNDWWSQQPVEAGGQVFLRWEEVQNSWWIITPASSQANSGQFLARTEQDILPGAAGICTIFGAPAGAELSTGATLSAINKFFGVIPADSWAWIGQNSANLAYYIVSTQRADHLSAFVQFPLSWPLNPQLIVYGNSYANPVPIQVYDPAGGFSLVQTTAFCRDSVCWSGENITVLWTGSCYVIASRSFDGGVYGFYVGADVPKGGSCAAGSMTIQTPGQRTQPSAQLATTATLNVPIFSPLGKITDGKKLYIGRNHGGLFAIAEEC